MSEPRLVEVRRNILKQNDAIARALRERFRTAGVFIENVGNLVCPSSYDLGENLRLVLMSVTEGEDKPQKYPTIFNSADVAVITKDDLAVAVEFDWEAARRSIESVRPGMQVFRLSAKSGVSMQPSVDFLAQRLAEQRTLAHS